MIGRIANFDDLDPLKLETCVQVDVVEPGRPLPLDAELIILPGSKNTISDLEFLRKEGWDIDIAAHVRRGGHVLGLCGGFQMLGRRVHDPDGLEGVAGSVAGLGHLDVETTLRSDKVVRPVRGRDLASGSDVGGYEIHLGDTTGPDVNRAWLEIEGRPEGARSVNGQVAGTYVHGLFSEDGFRRAFLKRFHAGIAEDGLNYGDTVDATLDALAAHLEAHVAVDEILRLARELPGQ